MITIEILQNFFANTRQLSSEGRVQFDIDAQCRWSFFFVDTSKDVLTKLRLHLENIGYEFVGFLEQSPDNDDQGTIYLRVDRIERHSVESLHKRNQGLYELATKFGVDDYDGMDVGATDGP